MAMKSTMCSMAGCDNPVKYKISGLCSSCYSFKYYWKKKTPTQVMKRITNLARWSKRMETMIPSKVTRIGKKRKAGNG